MFDRVTCTNGTEYAGCFVASQQRNTSTGPLRRRPSPAARLTLAARYDGRQNSQTQRLDAPAAPRALLDLGTACSRA